MFGQRVHRLTAWDATTTTTMIMGRDANVQQQLQQWKQSQQQRRSVSSRCRPKLRRSTSTTTTTTTYRLARRMWRIASAWWIAGTILPRMNNLILGSSSSSPLSSLEMAATASSSCRGTARQNGLLRLLPSSSLSCLDNTSNHRQKNDCNVGGHSCLFRKTRLASVLMWRGGGNSSNTRGDTTTSTVAQKPSKMKAKGSNISNNKKKKTKPTRAKDSEADDKRNEKMKPKKKQPKVQQSKRQPQAKIKKANQLQKDKTAAKTTTTSTQIHKRVVNQALHKSNAAQALGDAIRQHADELRQDHAGGLDDSSVTTTTTFDSATSPSSRSLESLGWALGASDYRDSHSSSSSSSSVAPPDDDVGGGGVGVSPSVVVAHYFLQSHGGAHALQCACSVLASVAGLGGLFLSFVPASNNHHQRLQWTLIRRCLWLAMIKHVSGLLAATVLAAQQSTTRHGGVRRSMQSIQQLATDPVAQYTFYTATMLVWLSASLNVGTNTVWWQQHRVVPFLLVGPVLLRELVSTVLVVSDVLVLWALSAAADTDTTSTSPVVVALIQQILTASRAVVDAAMSLVVTPSRWRTATAAQRQAILAKLVARISLVFEVAVGVLMLLDAGLGLVAVIFGTSTASTTTTSATAAGSTKAPSFWWQLVQRLLFTQLYWQFLWTRRRRIRRLATSVMRGGAVAQFPFYVLEVALDPRAAMGLDPPRSSTSSSSSLKTASSSAGSTKNKRMKTDMDKRTWRDYVRLALEDDEMAAAQNR